jgi:hypothetical protein
MNWILLGSTEGKRKLGTAFLCFRIRTMAPDCIKHGNCSVMCEKFPDYLSNCQILEIIFRSLSYCRSEIDVGRSKRTFPEFLG